MVRKALLEQEFQKIFDGEISVQIGWFWNGGIEVKLGDEMSGYVAETNVRQSPKSCLGSTKPSPDATRARSTILTG